jgi:hypothetical protein
MIGIAALAVGIVLGLVFHPAVPEVIQPYLPIARHAAVHGHHRRAGYPHFRQRRRAAAPAVRGMTRAGDDAVGAPQPRSGEGDEAMWGYLPLAGERSGAMTEMRSR